MIGAEAGAEIFDKLEPEPEQQKNLPAPQHSVGDGIAKIFSMEPVPH
jgi:hypothetical protein